jgi:hypothetical protein
MVSPRFITQPDEAATALFRFVVENPSKFPDDAREELLRLLEPGKSVAFAVSEAAELIYARQEDLDKDVVQLGAELAICASHNHINNFADDGGARGRGITEALRRASGEKTPAGMSWPSKDDDPTPKMMYVPGPDHEPDTVAPLLSQSRLSNKENDYG